MTSKSDEELCAIIRQVEYDVEDQKQDLNRCLSNIDIVLHVLAQQQDALNTLSMEILRLEEARLEERKRHPLIKFWEIIKKIKR